MNLSKCAKCNGDMLPFSPRHGIEIGMCRSCRGLWFPKGMLARQLDTQLDLPDGPRKAHTTSYECRGCRGVRLEETPFARDASLLVDMCPKCGGVFLDANELGQAIEIARRTRRHQASLEKAPAPSAALSGSSLAQIAAVPRLFIKQRKEWLEILTDWETRNKYDLMTDDGRVIGHAAEHGTGLGAVLARWILKSHRPFEANVWDAGYQLSLRFRRPFFWIFSDIFVETNTGAPLGSAHRRFRLFGSRYELHDAQGCATGEIRQSFWRIWRFTLYNTRGQEAGEISKRWAGWGRELFTSADTFQISFGSGTWTLPERAVILAAAIAIDLDRFETQSKGGGGLLGDGMSVLFD